MVYDVTQPDSFNNLSKWIKELKKGKNGKLAGVLVANKIDLLVRRQVTTEQGEAFAKQHGLAYFESSAVKLLFINIKPFKTFYTNRPTTQK